MRKSSDLASSAQCLAFYQDMSSLLFQAKDRALYGFFAFTLEILCLTCSVCQEGPDHKKKMLMLLPGKLAGIYTSLFQGIQVCK